VRAGHQRRSSDDQVRRGRDHRSRLDEGWVTPRPSTTRTWKKIAIIGSGPARLAAADQLNRAGHSVTVFKKSDRIGGLLRYGIPEFKMEKRHLAVMEVEGVVFRAGINVGVDVPARRLREDYDAVLLAGGAGQPRDLPVPGPRAERHSLRDGLPHPAEQALRGGSDSGQRVHHRAGQARDHHRRR
jgi:NADPH-dependent 2,4-dienoyl-CoA reductase/sulfur reductase-like enzyme